MADIRFCPHCGSKVSANKIDGESRLCCESESCNYVFWNNPTPIVGAIVELGNEIVLVQNNGWPEGMFGLVSGFLEAGETPDDCVLREVKEELGLEGRIESFIGYYSFLEMNQLILAFHVKAQGDITIGDEIADIKKVSPEKLKPWPFGTGPAVRDWLENRGN
ncbi:MAG: NUDIX domain-containing protein [Deltaproteobacteria bacterium]|nr:NUDIX domain-containing protein [Deltaproteobacteria bacterium]MBW1814431.1 NUDIX domain-containing protein [Deltaproteobacteria bacterium]MBW1846044.1 NUDIX domain-containing protein [Deltaproteobacteria bacterium]MBW1985451.1 NUDIX domain-containing protein [Deltaproteobacteria bacterium]MBW2178910.1 NUDIX domain-containing protein [Deltaproteobacteria bacterium]